MRCCHTYSCWSGSRGASKLGSYILASLPPCSVMPVDGEGRGQSGIFPAGQLLCRRETAPTEEVSSSYKIPAFGCGSTTAAAVWKRLQWPGVPSRESCDTTSSCFSCLLAQRWHLHPCFSDWSFPAPVGDVLPVHTIGNAMSSGQQTAAAGWEGDTFVHS